MGWVSPEELAVLKENIQDFVPAKTSKTDSTFYNQLWPKIAEFIANFHQINVLDATVRLDLALDSPSFCDTLESGCDNEAR